jgi:hypothetical protein
MEMNKRMPIKSKWARKSNMLFNKRIAMEQGEINSLDGRIFGNESIRKKQEFDKMISRQLEDTFNKYLRHQAEGMWIRDDLVDLDFLKKKKQ